MMSLSYDFGQSYSVTRRLLEHLFTWRNEHAAEIAEPNCPKKLLDQYVPDMCWDYGYVATACSNAATGVLSQCLTPPSPPLPQHSAQKLTPPGQILWRKA